MYQLIKHQDEDDESDQNDEDTDFKDIQDEEDKLSIIILNKKMKKMLIRNLRPVHFDYAGRLLK